MTGRRQKSLLESDSSVDDNDPFSFDDLTGACCIPAYSAKDLAMLEINFTRHFYSLHVYISKILLLK
jgi:hypothetical protein